MAKAIIVYGSTMGNTETVSGYVAEGLGGDVKSMAVSGCKVSDLSEYDLILMGCSTWGYGELQDDFIPFYESLEKADLSGKKAAVFGTGDSAGYPDTFCAAVDMIEARLKECGAEVVQPGLKVDVDIEAAREEAVAWGKSASGK